MLTIELWFDIYERIFAKFLNYFLKKEKSNIYRECHDYIVTNNY